MKQFAQLHQAGTTIILITHEQEVSEYASRTITVRDGVVMNLNNKENIKI